MDKSQKFELEELKTKEILGGVKKKKVLPCGELMKGKELGLNNLNKKHLSKKTVKEDKEKDAGFNPLGDLMDVVQENVLDIKEGVDEGVRDVINNE